MRPRNIAVIAAAATLAVLIVAYGVALVIDLGRYKPSIIEAAREATGRDLVIGGKLHLVPSFKPTLALEDVTLSNVDWGSQPNLFEARRVTVAVSFFALLSGRIELHRVDVDGAQVFLETDADGEPNWLLAPEGEAAEISPEEQARAAPNFINLRDVTVNFRDGQRDETFLLDLRHASSRGGGEDSLRVEAEGAFRGEVVSLDAALPPIADLFANRPAALRIEVSIGDARLSAEGTVKDPRAFSGLDLALRAEGPDASRLSALADRTISIDGPFAVAVRLTEAGGVYSLSGLDAQAGENSVSGDARLDTAVSPAVATLEIDSLTLDGGISGTARLAARGETPTEFLSTLDGSFELARAPGTDDGFALKGVIRHTPGAPRPTVIEVGGDIAGQDATLAARLGSLARLTSPELVPFNVSLGAGDTRFSIKGQAGDAFGEGKIEASFEFESERPAAFAEAFGASVPEGPVTASGRIEGSRSRIVLSGLDAAIGKSDVRGEVTVELGGPRPRILADLTSRRFDAEDLAPRQAGEAAASEAADAAELSDKPLPFAALRRADAEVRFRGASVVAGGADFGPVSFTLALTDGSLTIEDFAAAPSGVSLGGTLSLAANIDPPEVQAKLSGSDVDLRAALQERDISVAAANAETIEIEFSARGTSAKDLASSLKGDVRARGLTLQPSNAARQSRLALDVVLSLRGAEGGISLKGEGTLGEEAFKLSGMLPSIDVLRSGDPGEVSFEAKGHGGFLSLDGTPRDGAAIDYEIAGEGPLLRDLALYAGLTLPGEGPHSVSGVLHAAGDAYTLTGLSLMSGKSDLTADGTLDLGSATNRFNLRVTSANFDLDDFVSPDGEAAAAAGKSASGDDDTPLPFDVLREWEGTVTLQFANVRLRTVRFNDLSVNATLEDGTLSVPLTAQIGGKPVKGHASVAAGGEPAQVEFNFEASGIDPGEALTDERIGESFTTTVDTEINLRAQGATRAALMSSLSGRIQAIAGAGRFQEDKYLFFETGILRQLAPWEESREITNLNCFVADFVVENGVATADGVLFDTEFMSILGEGEIDFGGETLDLTFSPRPKEVRLLDLAIPVHLGGTFDKPSFRPTPTGVGKKVATTLGALVNPFVLLVPVIQSARNDKNPCVAALADVAAGGRSANGKKDEGVGGVIRGLGQRLNRVIRREE